jgi:membrane protein YdbS with pleckstrin-like domain
MSTDGNNAMTSADVRLPPSTLVYENARSVGGALLFLVAGWGLAYALLPSEWDFRISLGISLVALVGVSADVALNAFQQRHFRLRVLPRGMEMDRGRYFVTSVSIIPGAVLSVDLHTGPLLRRLGLARLRLNGIAQLPEIPPLAQVEAQLVQRLLVEQLDMNISSPMDAGAPWSP